MDRTEFLQMCQKTSLLKSGVCGIKKDVPNELIVKFGNFRYYPVAYRLSFDNGEPVHTAILHDLRSNSIIRVNLKDVKK